MGNVYKLNTKPDHMKFDRGFTIRLSALVSCLLIVLCNWKAAALPFKVQSRLNVHRLIYASFLPGESFTFSPISNNTIIQPPVYGICNGFSFDSGLIVGSDASPAGTTYNWQKSIDLGVTWTDVGVTLRDYNPPVSTKTTWYRRVAINGPDQDISNVVRIVIASTSVGNNTILTNQDIVSGATPQKLIGSDPNGGDGVSYEFVWEQSKDGSTWQLVPGAFTGRDYQPTALTTSTFYRRSVRMGVCPVFVSNTIKVTIVPVSVSGNTIIQPLENEKCGIASFNPKEIAGAQVSVTTGATFTYQWTQSIDGGATYTNIPGAVGQNYDPPELTRTTRFRRDVISGTVVNNSNIVFIIINPDGVGNNVINPIADVKAGVQPQLITGSDPTPSGNVFEFRWEQSADGLTGWTSAPGANTGKNYQPQPLIQTTYFHRKIGSGVCPSSESNSIKVTVLPSGAISNNKITAPPTVSYCGLSSVDPSVITGTAATNVLTYQWQQSFNNNSWSNIIDATGQNFDPSNLNQKVSFRRIAIAGTTRDTSNVVVFLVTPVALDNNTILSQPQVIPSGGIPAAIAGSLPTGGDGTYNYLWEKSEGGQNNWVVASGINNQLNYQPPAQSAPVYYRRTVTSGACSSTSEKYLIAITTNTDLAIEKTGGISDDVQNAVQFIIKAINKGPQDAMAIVVTDTLADNLEYISYKTDVGFVDYDPVKKIIKWEIDKLADKEEVKLRINAKPLENRNLINEAFISAQVVDADLSNNRSKAVIREVVFGIDAAHVPNMITPNGDGYNDVFKVPNIVSFPNNELTIMDRWGNRVYAVKEYQNNWNGEGLAEGTYFYVLKITVGNKIKVYKGFITLMRSRISG
ncbi:gliding motility-associated C-terminal domain-containing protein [Solitalea lacus]|uniref:T9SS type B sorting domain-containing protein n=1 Tax=Solitalea lacus TaxID=2911172 RepID=UPI001EDA3833|nr:gliding motility-associated C-terminal domain-containing protein [Solitalea lacus]UKJ09079.1 gliding motility-associated C-terminal domain-containing protein [Solitalea lacus]